MTGEQGARDKAVKFVNLVSFAKNWSAADPIYLDCLRDLTSAMPEDFQTYATSLEIKAETPIAPSASSTTVTAKADLPRTLLVTLQGRTSDAGNVTNLKIGCAALRPSRTSR